MWSATKSVSITAVVALFAEPLLCGLDPVTGNDDSYRRERVRQRLENLAACFAIDVATYCVMENHIHVILRTRPDRVASRSDEEEVVRRWLRLYLLAIQHGHIQAWHLVRTISRRALAHGFCRADRLPRYDPYPTKTGR